uniref:methylcrotonoyl-CoA carboxylase beta chain, mitochondrial-like n=1 Tax=Styela clava TaxID=7725 RepID=UPI00193A5852|nr:methylcrotonoyl-CoA carboxylase beta chain, mitochondrial-like [Styela clava]
MTIYKSLFICRGSLSSSLFGKQLASNSYSISQNGLRIQYSSESVSESLPKIKSSDSSMMKHIYSFNLKNIDKLRGKYNSLVATAYQGGGEKAIKRHVERNKKILVRERLKKILDTNSPVLEIGTLAGYDMEYGNIACAGVVTVIGKIHNTWCMVVANDATVKGGSIYPITLKKQLRCHQIAEENHLASIYLVDSGGAFLPLQSEIFNPGGRIFHNQAVMSSQGIPQIAFVCGSCTAGAAYIPTMAQEAVIADQIGTIFLGGPPLVQAATGEKVTPNELGGADLHSRLSGCTDHFVKTEIEGLKRVRDIVATSNLTKVKGENFYSEKDKTEICKLAAGNKEYSVDAHEIIKCLADNDGFHEYKEQYGTSLVTGFMFVSGILVGVIANNGYITDKAAKKGSNFVQLCGDRQIPVLFLQNLCHDETSSVNDTSNSVIKSRASLMQSIATCPCPKIVISVGGLVGSPHMHPMCSLSMGARFHFVWPNVRLGAEFLWNSNSDISYSEYETLKHKSTAFYGASQCWYDGIVLPEDTKEVIFFCLSIFEQERATRLQQANNQAISDPNNMHTVIRL